MKSLRFLIHFFVDKKDWYDRLLIDNRKERERMSESQTVEESAQNLSDAAVRTMENAGASLQSISEASQNGVNGAMEALGSAVGTWASKFGEMLEQYGPQAVEMTLDLIRLYGILTVIPSIVVSVGGFFVLRHFVVKGWQATVGWDKDGPEYFFTRLGLIAGGFFGGLTCFMAFPTDLFRWMAIFDPQIALAYKVLSNVLGL